MAFLRVRNWTKYQHYKDRNPPWIKLHFDLLTSEDWTMLDDASRVLAVASMLLASRNNGLIPKNPRHLQRVAYLNSLPDFKPLIDCGFLEEIASEPLADASTLLADASTLLADASTLHTNASLERETETETEVISHSNVRARGIKFLDLNLEVLKPKFSKMAIEKFGWSEKQTEKVWNKFSLHNRDRSKTDWPATWEIWCENERIVPEPKEATQAKKIPGKPKLRVAYSEDGAGEKIQRRMQENAEKAAQEALAEDGEL